MRDQRIYVYKIVVDGNAAPCTDDGLWTLAVCKPIIRQTARKGDLVFGFGRNSETPANRLVYVAEVTKRLVDGRYYEIPEFQHRFDCIYTRRSKKLVLRDNAPFHREPGALEHDLGVPPDYKRANVLVSTDFRYFGREGTDEWKAKAKLLKELVEGMGQGHRVNFNSQLHAELMAIKDHLWKKYDSMVLGKPLHAAGSHSSTTVEEIGHAEISKISCVYHEHPSC
jgi:hypothetical protein